MKILVTGGAGFIGSAVVRLAVARGHEVVNLDAMTYAANPETLDPVADDVASLGLDALAAALPMHQNVALHATDADFQKSSVDSCGTSAPLRHRLHTYTPRADSAQNDVSGVEGADRVQELGLWYVPIPDHM